MGFFTDLTEELNQALSNIKRIDEVQLKQDDLVKHEAIIKIIQSISSNPLKWDSDCKFNISNQGNRFSGYIKTIAENKVVDIAYYSEKIDILFYMCLRFLIESNFIMDSDGREYHPISDIGELLRKLKDEAFYSDVLSTDIHIRYAFYEMSIHILNFYMGQEGFQVFLKFEDRKQELDNSLNKYNDELSANLEQVKALNERLEQQKTAFNFVGLSKGFEKILGEKEATRKNTFWGLICMGVVTLLPLLISFYNFIIEQSFLWQKMLPVIGLEFILIYFFRVVLGHYNSIQTQIMQLELRQSLCQFIQSYAEYAKEIKSNDGVSLEKFENLIFSSILSNPDKVPGTFDGIESVTSLIKELRTK